MFISYKTQLKPVENYEPFPPPPIHIIECKDASKRASVSKEIKSELLTAQKPRRTKTSVDVVASPSPISWLEDSKNDSVFASGRTSQLVDRFER